MDSYWIVKKAKYLKLFVKWRKLIWKEISNFKNVLISITRITDFYDSSGITHHWLFYSVHLGLFYFVRIKYFYIEKLKILNFSGQNRNVNMNFLNKSNVSTREVVEELEKTKHKLQKSQTRLINLSAAYKALQEEKKTLEATISAISS